MATLVRDHAVVLRAAVSAKRDLDQFLPAGKFLEAGSSAEGRRAVATASEARGVHELAPRLLAGGEPIDGVVDPNENLGRDAILKLSS
jgi:hypothetical protein